MRAIPVYGLYGEGESSFGQDWLHWETIQSRSRLHGYRIAPHRHEHFFQVLLLTAGQATASLDGTEAALHAPATVVVPALTVHSYGFSPDVDGTVLTLMEREVAATGLTFSNAAVTHDAGPIQVAMSAVIAEAQRPGAWHEQALRSQVALLLVALHRAVDEEGFAARRVGPAVRHAQAFRALVDRRFRETRRIADYAKELGISPTHLNRICREVTGGSALQVIERRIALEARRQLRFSGLSIKQIAAELGYDDPAYFTRFATRVLGMPPSSYRDASTAGL